MMEAPNLVLWSKAGAITTIIGGALIVFAGIAYAHHISNGFAAVLPAITGSVLAGAGATHLRIRFWTRGMKE